ncbi:DinB family protein [Modestobacter versicolor]|uniref:Mini-circle protein n=1 Tax=Modestobacter versicolor TaxID=429133 RepID=A0A323VHT1_9ACTN|nr:DinB family protein [Modestobacter versicolor]MBB3677052.1 putative damage-inducible protein DinB [Modestobacter versicolor]PZA22646.1 Mini-circle protein [Modestobacter versicolor]
MPEFPPAPERTDPPYRDGERAAVEAWLEFHRATLLVKCAGLTPEQLGERSVPPSSLSLRGLLRHMTEVERSWFRRVLAGQQTAPLYYGPDDEDGDFDAIGRDTDHPDTETAVTRELAAFTAECDSSRALAAEHDSLDDVGAGLRHGQQVSLRWIYLHMIEEYARHNGHADLLRERIDGATGD